MTGPQRRARRHQRRDRAPRVLVFGVAGVAAIIAGGAVVAIALASGSSPAESRPTPLATNVAGSQSVGLANLGPPTAGGATAGAASALLARAPGGLGFTPGTGGDAVLPSQQWQADQMGDGSYILIFTPGGQCLTTAATRQGDAARLAACRLGLGQRWSHPYLGTDATGRGYWQLRSMADGRCLAVGGQLPGGAAAVALRPCSPSMAWQQLITFFTPF